MYKYFKRIFDILFSLLFLIPLMLLICVVALFIKADDNGAVFYNGERLGKNGKVFKMFKFRSMKMNAPDIRLNDGSTYNGEDDPRVTKIGKVLRKTSIDEIPQILNVLKGDMSFIGPRPDLPQHMQLYTDEEKRKLEVRPGITGYSQAYYRNSVEWKQRIIGDIYYIDNMTLLLDLKILFKTISTVLNKKGVYVDVTREEESQYERN